MEYLAINILSENKVGIAEILNNLAANSLCNIVDCKMTTLGEEISSNILISGNWNEIAKLESCLDTLQKDLNISILKQRTKAPAYPDNLLPYNVYITSKDEPKILYEIVNFFKLEHVEITELVAESRPAKKTGTPIMSLIMSINISVSENIADLRERFIVFCDSFNLDGVMEAEKGL